MFAPLLLAQSLALSFIMADTGTFISGADGNEVFQAQYIPKQTAPLALDHPSMKAFICTFPPLGQVTQIDQNTSTFTALLEVDEARVSDPWQVSLWHSGGEEWVECPMDPLRDSLHPTALQSGRESSGSPLRRLYFATPLAIRFSTHFTIKFRAGSDQPWKWVRDHQGTSNGTVMMRTVTPQGSISSDLGDFVKGLNPALTVKSFPSQSPGTSLWSVEASVEAADGEKSVINDIKLGLPWGNGNFSR